jgi:hypothetical protein
MQYIGMQILLVCPDFPIRKRSRKYKFNIPIGLLKIAVYLKEKGHNVKLVFGQTDNIGFTPDIIGITSLFTYWAEYVKGCVQFYKEKFPNTKTVVGGIYASLIDIDEIKAYTGCDDVYQGLVSGAETCMPDYSLLPEPIDFQIVHASRGCPRRCAFCGTWHIENSIIYKKSIKDEIVSKHVVFFDNNFLANPNIDNILNELIELKKARKIVSCESQSGFDGRILMNKPYLAKMLKQAGFKYPRIAWDWGYNDWPKIEKQINILEDAGFSRDFMFIFMLYNWDILFEEMEQKRLKCWEWQIQILGSRFRPLDVIYDNYNVRNPQTSEDYYINPKWTDKMVKTFHMNIRKQNICVRTGSLFYSLDKKYKDLPENDKKLLIKSRDLNEITTFLDKNGINYWLPVSTK